MKIITIFNKIKTINIKLRLEYTFNVATLDPFNSLVHSLFELKPNIGEPYVDNRR